METIVTTESETYLADLKEYNGHGLVKCKEPNNPWFGQQVLTDDKQVVKIEDILLDGAKGGFQKCNDGVVIKHKDVSYGFLVEVEYTVKESEEHCEKGHTQFSKLELKNFRVVYLKWDKDVEEIELTVTKEIKDYIYSMYHIIELDKSIEGR